MTLVTVYKQTNYILLFVFPFSFICCPGVNSPLVFIVQHHNNNNNKSPLLFLLESISNYSIYLDDYTHTLTHTHTYIHAHKYDIFKYMWMCIVYKNFTDNLQCVYDINFSSTSVIKVLVKYLRRHN